MNIFQKAVKEKLIFECGTGVVNVLDLYSLPLTSENSSRPSLDAMARAVYKRIREQDEVSFVVSTARDKAIEVDNLRLDIIKAVIADKMEDQEKARKARANAEMRERLLAVRARKEDARLEDMSVEDIDKLLADLN